MQQVLKAKNFSHFFLPLGPFKQASIAMPGWHLLFPLWLSFPKPNPTDCYLYSPPKPSLVVTTCILNERWLLLIWLQTSLQKHAAFHPGFLFWPPSLVSLPALSWL